MKTNVEVEMGLWGNRARALREKRQRRRMKTWNKNLYYAVKYSVVALILGAIVASAFN